VSAFVLFNEGDIDRLAGRMGTEIKDSFLGEDQIMAHTTEYVVVVNQEGQYSIWPDCREIPLGWTDVGVRGAETVCLEYIQGVWVDMTPKSLCHPNRVDSESS
jgi:MbtH protein